MRAIFVASLIVVLPAVAPAQNFSCSYGDRGACLGYGDTVCSSSGMCVSDDAICFDSYQCGYEGFTCKSNVTECRDEYNDLVRKFNDLLSDYEELEEVAERMRRAKSDMEYCLQSADDLEEAKACQWY